MQDRFGETFPAFRRPDERERPADHAFHVILLKPVILVQDRQRVDGHPELHRPVPRARYIHPGIAEAVAAYVDHPPGCREPAAVEQLHRLSMALPIAVLPSRGGRVMSAMLSANCLASAGSPIRVQGTTVSSVFGPAHWTSVTAIALFAADRQRVAI